MFIINKKYAKRVIIPRDNIFLVSSVAVKASNIREVRDRHRKLIKPRASITIQKGWVIVSEFRAVFITHISFCPYQIARFVTALQSHQRILSQPGQIPEVINILSVLII